MLPDGDLITEDKKPIAVEIAAGHRPQAARPKDNSPPSGCT
jgi:hypothetical protein